MCVKPENRLNRQINFSIVEKNIGNKIQSIYNSQNNISIIGANIFGGNIIRCVTKLNFKSKTYLKYIF